ncbi:MAG TPA: hypothetical protein VN962_05180 [Polyangia bacterium]|nr:hypothetical protein [Polyangia bacterium]
MRLAFLAVVASLLWLAGRVQAATVMIVRPASPSAELTEAVSRLHGELLAVGLSVMIVDRDGAAGPAGESPQAWLEELAHERRIDAAIDVLGGARLEAADVWVFPPAPRGTTVTRAPVQRDVEDVPARLAIRATDLLRSLLIENDLAGPVRPAAPPALAAAAGPPPSEDHTALGVDLGVAMLASLGGAGPAIAPLVRAGGSFGPWWGLEVEAAGFGTRPAAAGSGGSARVAQQYALAGVCLCARSGARWQPVIGLSAGALRTAAEGEANPPLQAHAVARWSLLMAASAGARVRLTERAHLSLMAELQLAQPYPEVRVVNDAVATIGRPNLVVSLALGEWL